MTKSAYFLPNLVFFGPKILILTEGNLVGPSKKPNKTKKPQKQTKPKKPVDTKQFKETNETKENEEPLKPNVSVDTK